MKGNGEARSEKCGSVIRLMPESCRRKEAWPIQVSVGFSRLSRSRAVCFSASGKVTGEISGASRRQRSRSANELSMRVPSLLRKRPSARWCAGRPAGGFEQRGEGQGQQPAADAGKTGEEATTGRFHRRALPAEGRFRPLLSLRHRRSLRRILPPLPRRCRWNRAVRAAVKDRPAASVPCLS